jgi:hypothetical protein
MIYVLLQKSCNTYGKPKTTSKREKGGCDMVASRPQAGNDRGPAAALAECATERLLDELERRSLGCVCVCVRIEAGRGDVWDCRVRGSTVLLGAMTAVASLKASRLVAARNETEPPA